MLYNLSNSGWSFLNTPIGKGKHFMIPSSVGDVRSSASFNPKAALKRSATTDNVMNCLIGSDAHDPPSTILRSTQKRFRDIGSDEKKIISGFLNTPLLIVRTPKHSAAGSMMFKKDLPRSPLQKVTMKLNSGFICESDPHGSSLFVKETSSLDEMSSPHKNEHQHDDDEIVEATFTRQTTAASSSLVDTFNKESTPPSSLSLQSKDSSISSFTFNTSSSSRRMNPAFTVKSTAVVSTNIQEADAFINKLSEKRLLTNLTTSTSFAEHETFQATLKSRAKAEQDRIEALSVQNARKIQRLKAGPTTLPIKSTKPLTVPEEFIFGYDGRAQLKKMNNLKQEIKPAAGNFNVKPLTSTSSTYQKPPPTVPKSPMFASKIRSQQLKGSENVVSESNSNYQNTSEMRRKFEYRPAAAVMNNNSNNHLSDKIEKIPLTIPKSPKLSSINRNRNK